MKCCACECLRTSVARMAIFFCCEVAEADFLCEAINAGAAGPRHTAAPPDAARIERNSRRVCTLLFRSDRDETDGSGINYEGRNAFDPGAKQGADLGNLRDPNLLFQESGELKPGGHWEQGKSSWATPGKRMDRLAHRGKRRPRVRPASRRNWEEDDCGSDPALRHDGDCRPRRREQRRRRQRSRRVRGWRRSRSPKTGEVVRMESMLRHFAAEGRCHRWSSLRN